MVGPVTGISLPQLSYTTGTVGITASAAQATVEEPAAGSVNVGGVRCISICPGLRYIIATGISIS